MNWSSEGLACLVLFIYCSYFEWFIHRHLMHVKRPFPFQEAFRGHTVVHHQLYHWDGKFEAEGPRAPHVTLRWYAFPVMIGLHMPFFALFQWLTHWPIFWGATLGCVLYFSGYEYTHYLMHVSLGHSVERLRVFRFLKEHHRLHHKYYLRNLNVFVPLADLSFGTLVTSEGWRSKQAKRDRALTRQSTETRKVPVKVKQ